MKRTGASSESRRDKAIKKQMETVRDEYANLAMEHKALQRRCFVLANLYGAEAARLERKAEEVRA